MILTNKLILLGICIAALVLLALFAPETVEQVTNSLLRLFEAI